MLEIFLDIFLTIFSVIAALIGAIGAMLATWLWAGSEFFGKPLKVNGVGGPMDWSKRVQLAGFFSLFGCLTMLGAWLYANDWLAPYLASSVAITPWWVIAAWLALSTLIPLVILHRSSEWPKLRKVYLSPRGEALATRRLTWAVMGKGVTFKNALTISAFDDGLGVSQNRLLGPFSKPILVPWNQVRIETLDAKEPAQVRLSFNGVEQVELTMQEECWLSIAQHRPRD